MYIYLRACFFCPHIPPLHRDAEGSHSGAYTDGNKQHVFPACNGNARRSVNCVNTELSEGQFRFGDIAQKGIPIFV